MRTWDGNYRSSLSVRPIVPIYAIDEIIAVSNIGILANMLPLHLMLFQ